MSVTDTGPKAIASPTVHDSEFARMLNQFADRVEVVELQHSVGDLTITRTMRVRAGGEA